MAIMETVTIQTVNEPTKINQLHERYSLFFWNVLNVQVTHVRDSHLEFKDFGETVQVKSVTTNIEYATITYERDKLMPHYDEIVRAEKELDEYETALSEKRKRLNAINTRLRWWLWGVALGIGGWLESVLPVVVGSILGILLIAGVVVYTFKSKKKAERLYDEYLKDVNEFIPQVERAKANAVELNGRVLRELRS